ncbi:ABC transporter ATP-binding protein [Massilia sp. CF038]|uniref:ABC transporter ATP-binding protein n=1 Tax=Massilia sp. CF038 TaxID=1881045 RepID=UPI0009161AF1|nr:ABC transporter ATP-binding protein [Massilia sp. CF038]SHH63345.1 carbohydrate ABC transporter ATP-binding protein, CUT1 family [Massilia sp. CF038]
MSNVCLRKLSITLGANEIIKELDLSVEEGEFLVLLGPSGCGKSTLLHSVAGLIDVSGGTVEIGGADMTHADPSERGIGMVFQSYALYPTMTVAKNMSFGLRIAGTPKAEIERRLARAAEMLHLEALLDRKPAQLSGGQRQRVAIGRALVRQAGVFLFDEPLSNLDAKLRAELRRELKLLHQTLRSTMIYVTHDQVEAMTLATRIVVMRAGVIQQIGAPSEVYERPANLFVAGFLGSPSMNFIEGELDALGRFTSSSLMLDTGIEAKAGAVVLGIRPEHISVSVAGQFEGSVALVEPMGNHQIVWIAVGERKLSAIVNDTRVFNLGDAVRFGVDTRRVSLFDKASEQRLAGT